MQKKLANRRQDNCDSAILIVNSFCVYNAGPWAPIADPTDTVSA